jgi:two-component system, NarL family, response regulator LiaR
VAEAPIRVLVADDHAVVREGLRTFLGLQDGIEVVGEAADGEQAVAEAQRLAPDVVLMDLVMPGLDGVGAMRRLRESLPGARVIVLTSFGDDERLLPAIRAGAAGYLLKDASIEEIIGGVDAALRGDSHVAPQVTGKLLRSIRDRPAEGGADWPQLTDRELEVLDLMIEGRDNAAIARALFISQSTVKHHVSAILMKLGVENRVQAVVRAVRNRGR